MNKARPFLLGADEETERGALGPMAAGLDERRDGLYFESLGNTGFQEEDESICHFSFYGWDSDDEDSTEEESCSGEAIALSWYFVLPDPCPFLSSMFLRNKYLYLRRCLQIAFPQLICRFFCLRN